MSEKRDESLTKLLHLDQGLNRHIGEPHHFPICQTSTYCFGSVEEAREAFSGKLQKDFYTRYSNPNHRRLETMLAILEEGEEAQIFATGMAAINALFVALLEWDDQIVCNKPIYGGTFQLLKSVFEKQYYVNPEFVDGTNPMNVASAVTEGTKLVFLETPTNPTLTLCDIEKIARLVKEKNPNALIAVDNTFATPFNQKPLKLGADIVVHSLTKNLNGDGRVLGGAIVCSKKIMEKISSVYAYLGGMMDPAVASHIEDNLKTFPLRMKRHNENAFKVARFLSYNGDVLRVYYPGLKNHPQYEIAKKQMSGFGAVVSFELAGPIQRTVNFLNLLAKSNIVTLGVSLGTMDTLIESPAQMTHFGIPEKQRLEEGISDKLIRMSVGLENVEDIIQCLYDLMKKA